MTHGPADTKNELLAAEDLLAIERRRPLTEHEQRRLNMCLAASEPLQWLRQLGRDFDAVAVERDDDARMTQACVDAARKHFMPHRVASPSLHAGFRVSMVVASLLLLSISAAAAWNHWSRVGAARGSEPGVSAATLAHEQRAKKAKASQQDPLPIVASSTRADVACPSISASVTSVTPVDAATAHAASTGARQAPSSALVAPAPKSASELFSDANAARRSGDTDLAVSSYRRLQTEHPQSDEALLSHVLLARLELARGAPGTALRHFEVYSLRAPSGSLVQEALQGKAQALTRLGRKQEAAATWRQLLERYPTSVYAESAREQLGDSPL